MVHLLNSLELSSLFYSITNWECFYIILPFLFFSFSHLTINVSPINVSPLRASCVFIWVNIRRKCLLC